MLYILTYGSNDDNLYFLKHSAPLYELQVENLAQGGVWNGYQDKLWGVRKWILGKSFDPCDRIMFVDAYDVILSGSELDIWQGYKEYGSPDLLFAAEKNSYPFDEDYPEVETEYRFLNSGGYIGTPEAILKMINWIDDDGIVKEICRVSTDQGYVVRYYLEEGQYNNVLLDTKCLVFNCMWGVDWNKEVAFEDGRFVNTVLHSRPSVIHFNCMTYLTKNSCNIMVSILEIMRKRESGKLPHLQ